MAVHREAGTVTHRLIAAAVAAPGPLDLDVLSKAMFKHQPVGGTIRASVRISCVTRASMYLKRIRPLEGWTLVGCEVRLDNAVADLVWEHDSTGDVAIDEVKAGTADLSDDDLADQVRRLWRGGMSRWSERFIGVRLVPLRAPALTRLVIADGDRFMTVPDDRLAVR
jgi:hypothetical protein